MRHQQKVFKASSSEQQELFNLTFFDFLKFNDTFAVIQNIEGIISKQLIYTEDIIIRKIQLVKLGLNYEKELSLPSPLPLLVLAIASL